jgi:hypothetical protein
MKKIFKIYNRVGVFKLILIILKKLKIIKYTSLTEKKKYEINDKIINITNKIVISGPYKNIKLNCNSRWSNEFLSTKLLGLYEVQVQEKIIELKKKYKLNYLINFGSSDGYHLIGLIKNNFFKSGLAYEISSKERKELLKNLEINKIVKKVKVFKAANFDYINNNLSKKILTKTLFLVDIEGNEFSLFNKKNLNFYKNSILIIENHDFFLKGNKIINNFFRLLKKNFNINFLLNGSRNPYKIKEISKLNDDERWLMMSEGRICEQNWLVCTPKNI